MTLVISVGGSVIVPDHINYQFLKKFKKVILKASKKEKIVLITGGGSTAREYFQELKGADLDRKSIGLIGMATTRLNARVVSAVFGITRKLPESIVQVKKYLQAHDLVICGALGFNPDMTTDGNAAMLAASLKARKFINITNVKGLYDKNPKKFKSARFIPHIHYNQFDDIMGKMKFKPGQHFILDQSASKIIQKHRIKTLIVGSDIKNLKRCLKDEFCIGTIIA